MNIFGDLEDLEQVFNLDGKYDNVTRDKFYKTFCGVNYAQWQNNSPQIPTSRVQFPPLLKPGERVSKKCASFWQPLYPQAKLCQANLA